MISIQIAQPLKQKNIYTEEIEIYNSNKIADTKYTFMHKVHIMAQNV